MELLSFLLLHKQARFYRVEVAENLFGEYSVRREWGHCGRFGQARLAFFANLRDAIMAADRWNSNAIRRGYFMERVTA